mgnify:CR=1 FL=1
MEGGVPSRYDGPDPPMTEATGTSPSGPGMNSIVAITSSDGSSNIMISEDFNVSEDSLKFRSITSFDNGIQLLSLSWHDKQLLVDGVFLSTISRSRGSLLAIELEDVP